MRKQIKETAETLKRDVPAIFLAMKDKRTPWIAKAFASLAIIYVLSPVDLIPDFIPVLGELDDLVIVPFFVALAIKNVPKDVMQSCRERAGDMWKDGKPVKWYYALPFVAVWAIVIFAIVRVILSGVSR